MNFVSTNKKLITKELLSTIFMKTLQEEILEIIEPAEKGNLKSKVFDEFIMLLVMVNVAVVVLESYDHIRINYAEVFQFIEVFSVVVFTVEYLLRLWTAKLRPNGRPGWVAMLRFVLSPLAMIDLLAILPFYLPLVVDMDLRWLRLMRVLRSLRVLKLNRYSKSFELVLEVLWEKRADLFATIFVIFILLIMFSSMMYYLEKDLQPKAFPNIVETLWWAVATLTTVGYGDVVPITGAGKVLSSCLALLGIGIVALPTGILSSAFLEKLDLRHQHKANPTYDASQFKYCPHCGKKLGGNEECIDKKDK